MKTSRAFWVSSVAAILLMSIVSPVVAPADAAVPEGFTDTIYASGLSFPTAMEFAPDGRLFVSEKGGDLRVIKNGVLLEEPFVSISVNSEGERGLLGIAFDPNFESNGYVYVYYTTSTSPIHAKVTRFTADPSNPDRALPGSETHILELEPFATFAHVGGSIEFGSDGKLYVSVGDNYYSYLSQSLTSRFGKILRINADGTVPSDNPFYNVQGAYPEIWALGLRNPFTFQFSGDGSRMYIADVGQHDWEEINYGLGGANYGWPECEGPCSNPDFVDPIYSYPTSSAGGSIIGGPFYEADQFPAEYQDNYFFGDYVQGWIKRLTPTNQVLDFADGLNSPVAIEIGPDGSLYYLSIGAGQVRMVQYGTPGPTAVASANPTSGPQPLSVNFSASGSIHPDGGSLSYSWNFGDGSPNAGGISVTHTYETAGNYVATLTVNDENGRVHSDTVGITVGNPPVGTIDTPAEGARYNAGDVISFSGSAIDPEDGTLPSSAFEWVVLFHHGTHTHPFQEYNGVTNGSFAIPTVGETDDDVWYRIYLRVTDSDGLTHTTTRDVLPNKSTVTLESNVSGLRLALDGQPLSTPHSFVGVVGISRTLEAPLTQTFDGQIYEFESWSNGGDRIHNISTPVSDATITAFYSPTGTAPEQTLTVTSADMSGNTLTGYFTTIASGDTIVHSGYTPLTFTGIQGLTYSITVHDYGGATFDHWEDGSTERTRTITLNSNAEFTAFYRTVTGERPSTFNLSVRSADTSGNTITGYYTTIESGGSTVQTGFTPLTYVGQDGESYTVTIHDFAEATFSHWEDGSTERTRTITLNSNIIMTAHFTIGPPPPAEHTLTVTSVGPSGNTITGYYTTIESGGSTVQTGFTPLTFTGTAGTTYTVSIRDYGGLAFAHWEDGSITRARTLSLNSDTTVAAYYRESALNVYSADLAGNTITGYYTTIESGGSTVQTGFTPLSFAANTGDTYTVAVQDYGNFVFDHWENGSTIRARTLTYGSDVVLTAHYRDTTAPPGVPTLVVESLSPDNKVRNMWVFVEEEGNIIQEGFSPLWVEIEPGNTYTVTVNDYQGLTFSHWEDGSEERSRTVTPSERTTIIAHYTTLESAAQAEETSTPTSSHEENTTETGGITDDSNDGTSNDGTSNDGTETTTTTSPSQTSTTATVTDNWSSTKTNSIALHPTTGIYKGSVHAAATKVGMIITDPERFNRGLVSVEFDIEKGYATNWTVQAVLRDVNNNVIASSVETFDASQVSNGLNTFTFPSGTTTPDGAFWIGIEGSNLDPRYGTLSISYSNPGEYQGGHMKYFHYDRWWYEHAAIDLVGSATYR